MRKLLFTGLLLAVIAGVAIPFVTDSTQAQQPSKLLVVWTGADKDAAINMVYMYTYFAKFNGWWDEVTFLVWGPSAKLLAEDADVQAELAKLKEAGVTLTACIVCANRYGVTDQLKEMGLDVKGMGQPLTEMLQTGWTTITF